VHREALELPVDDQAEDAAQSATPGGPGGGASGRSSPGTARRRGRKHQARFVRPRGGQEQGEGGGAEGRKGRAKSTS